MARMRCCSGVVLFVMGWVTWPCDVALAAPSAPYCGGAEGDKAVAPDNPIGISLPEKRACLNVPVAKLIQGPKGEVLPAAVVKDKAGNLYVTGRTKGFADSTYGDLFLAKFSQTGDLTWFKTYGTPKRDTFPITGVHDPSSGVEGMLAIDTDDKLYVVANYLGNHGVVMKVDADGRALWAKALPDAEFQAVSVAKGVVHVASLGILALDAKTGASRGGIKLKPKVPLRTFAVRATNGGEIYLGGWAGFSGDDDAVLFKLTHKGNGYDVVWDRRIPAPRGAKISSLDVGGDGSIYAGLNVTGAANVRMEVLKFSPAGVLLWARRYGDATQSDTNVVKVVGNQLIVAGNTFAKGSATFSDGRHGDGALLLVNADGSLAKEHYFFTGTNPSSLDSVRDVEVHQGRLWVVAEHFGQASFGEWRNPNEYGDGVLQHVWLTVDPGEYPLSAVGATAEPHAGPSDLPVGSKVLAGSWQDVTASVLVKAAAAGAADGHTSTSLSMIQDYLR